MLPAPHLRPRSDDSRSLSAFIQRLPVFKWEGAPSYQQGQASSTLDAYVEAKRARYQQLVKLGPLVLKLRNRLHPGGWVLVSPDPSKPNGWRATRFDLKGEPLGHSEASTFAKALKYAVEVGGVILEVDGVLAGKPGARTWERV